MCALFETKLLAGTHFQVLESKFLPVTWFRSYVSPRLRTKHGHPGVSQKNKNAKSTDRISFLP